MIATFTTQIASESISEDLKAKKFPGGACPQTPLNGALSHAIQSPPQTFSMLRFAPPFYFLKETLVSVPLAPVIPLIMFRLKLPLLIRNPDVMSVEQLLSQPEGIPTPSPCKLQYD